MNRERIRRPGAMAAIAAFALVVLAACGSNPAEEAEHEEVTRIPTMSDAAAQATREGASGTPGAATAVPSAAVSVTITSNDIFFDPKEVTIPANTDVKFILPNKGATAHDFSIDALDVQVSLPAGETKEIVINAPAGEYEYYCNVPGHKQAGMVGKLIVSEEAAPPVGAATPAAAGSPAATPVSAAAPQEAATAAAPAATPAAEAQAAAEAPVVTAYDIYFDPKEFSIPANTDVTVKLPNEGVTAHDFSIDALNISVALPPGETQEVVINAPAGTYEYYCNVPGHKQAGMVGTLTVK